MPPGTVLGLTARGEDTNFSIVAEGKDIYIFLAPGFLSEWLNQ